jgi:hypothetical protein
LEQSRRTGRERRWFLVLGFSWLFLSLFDLLITFWALAAGRAIEANPVMAPIIHSPVVATCVKLLLVYLGLKAVELIRLRTRYSSIPVLALMNLHIALTCLNNVLVVHGMPIARYLRFVNLLG